jgi:hypothetical protein
MAVGPSQVRKQAVASMLVTGSVEFSPDGYMHRYVLDGQDKLPPIVLQVIRESMPSWTVQFDNKPTAPAEASMTLRMLARPLGNGHTEVSIVDTDLDWHDDDGESPRIKTPPATATYPSLENSLNVSGTAYVVAQLDPQGRVAHATAEQVNLDVVDSSEMMERFRRHFAAAAVRAVKHWRFTLSAPTAGKNDAGMDMPWLVRVPVRFLIHDRDREKPGQWHAYIPGPRMPVPWIRDPERLAGSADVVVPGGLQLLERGPRLVTSQAGTGQAGINQGGR